MSRACSLCFTLAAFAAAGSRNLDDKQTARVALLQVRRSLPQHAEFFDDVPAPVLQKASAKGSHAVFADKVKPPGDSLVIGAQPASNHRSKPATPAALLATAAVGADGLHRDELKEEASSLKPLEGIREVEKPEREDLNDPRAAGFSVQSYNAGGGFVPEKNSPAGKPNVPNAWDLLSLAGAGARSAIKTAMPQWHGGHPVEDDAGRPKVEEIRDVDRSASLAPGAASFITR